jgi:hypothetical protein
MGRSSSNESKGYEDGFATEQERYFARLRLANQVQNQIFTKHQEAVVKPKMVEHIIKEHKQEQEIKIQKNRLENLVRMS